MLVTNTGVTWRSADPFVRLLQVRRHRCCKRHRWKSSTTRCATWWQRARSPPGCSAVDSWLEESTPARWDRATCSRAVSLTSEPDLITFLPSLSSQGRLRRSPGVFRGEWEVVPGRRRELGWGLCSSEQAWCLQQGHQAERVDQEGDRGLMTLWGKGTDEDSRTMPTCRKNGDGTFESDLGQVSQRFSYLAADWGDRCKEPGYSHEWLVALYLVANPPHTFCHSSHTHQVIFWILF